MSNRVLSTDIKRREPKSMFSVGDRRANNQVQYIPLRLWRYNHQVHWEGVKNSSLWASGKLFMEGCQCNSKSVISQGVLPGAWVLLRLLLDDLQSTMKYTHTSGVAPKQLVH